MPKAAAELYRTHPGIELNLVDAHPVDGLNMLRTGHVDIALIFRHADTPPDEEEGFRLTHLLDDGARQIYAATYGDPPDPPATTALIEILAAMGTTLQAGE